MPTLPLVQESDQPVVFAGVFSRAATLHGATKVPKSVIVLTPISGLLARVKSSELATACQVINGSV